MSLNVSRYKNKAPSRAPSARLGPDSNYVSGAGPCHAKCHASRQDDLIYEQPPKALITGLEI